MHLKLERFASNAYSTIGILFVDGKFACFTCEDAFHETKIPGSTRIPQGTYRLRLKPIGSSRMDAHYIQQFGSIHEGMVELASVPNFTGVLIHIGNTSKDTEGCILVGAGANALGALSCISSVSAYSNLYPKLRDAVKAGTASMEITDRDRI